MGNISVLKGLSGGIKQGTPWLLQAVLKPSQDEELRKKNAVDLYSELLKTHDMKVQDEPAGDGQGNLVTPPPRDAKPADFFSVLDAVSSGKQPSNDISLIPKKQMSPQKTYLKNSVTGELKDSGLPEHMGYEPKILPWGSQPNAGAAAGKPEADIINQIETRGQAAATQRIMSFKDTILGWDKLPTTTREKAQQLATAAEKLKAYAANGKIPNDAEALKSQVLQNYDYLKKQWDLARVDPTVQAIDPATFAADMNKVATRAAKAAPAAAPAKTPPPAGATKSPRQRLIEGLKAKGYSDSEAATMATNAGYPTDATPEPK